jgi:hypothetical protein
MAKTKPELKLLSGCMYLFDEYLDSYEFSSFKKELSKAKESDDQPYILSRGNIFKNEKALKYKPNDIIIFDLTLKDYWGGSFRGFLYPDETVSGKIKYVEGSKLKDDTIKGNYKWVSKNKFIIVGNCAVGDGGNE